MASQRDPAVRTLLRDYGRTFAEEAGIPLGRNDPSGIFRLLCASSLYGARISATVATAAIRALAKAGWISSAKMAASTWEERTRVLNQNGYARYDESTSRRLGDMAQTVEEKYGGDLRHLRDEADRDPGAERLLLRQFKGMGEVSVNIFLREVQAIWPEIYPCADARALNAARRLELPSSAQGLAELVSRPQLPKLVAALVRFDLDKRSSLKAR